MNNNVNNSLQNQLKLSQLAAIANLPAQNPCNTCNLNPEEHFKYVDNLVLLKIIDENTGKSIKQNMTAKFNNNNGLSTFAGVNSFDIRQSEFLKSRECLLNYLLNVGVELDSEDLKNIEAIVLELEKNALAREKNQIGQNALDELKQSNELAKERLITGSMQGVGVQNPPTRLFSREEIGKMSTAEFIKNEPVINYQLQNGLL